MMTVLVNGNGKVMLKGGGAISLKPYRKSWGYAQAKTDGTTAMYEWVLKCLRDGFAVKERTVAGNVYAVDGGDVGENYEGFRWIVIPVIQFGISSKNTIAVWDCLDRVVRYNWELCYHDGDQKYTYKDGLIETVSFSVPNDAQRRHMQTKMAEGVKLAREKVFEICGVSVRDKLTATQKRNVTKVIHDWIMERTHYEQNHEAIKDTAAYYLTQLAYSALTDEADVKPICAGYAAAMAYLCNMYRINCVFVSGFAMDDTVTKPTDHAWNIVSFTLPYGEYSSDPSQWAAMDLTWDDKRLDGIKQGTPWEYFCTDKVYHERNTSEITRSLDDRGYPFGDHETIVVPTATYPYTGNTLFGIDDLASPGGDSR